MFRIKICGVTTAEDARVISQVGGDAIGLNFYEMSPRYVSPVTARQIVAAVPNHVKKVGVFVNAPAETIRSLHKQLGLDLVQLHGDEPPEFLSELAGIPILRAFRPKNDLAPVAAYLKQCKSLGCLPVMVLVDAFHADQYGGTGKTADWSQLEGGQLAQYQLPFALAGGLKPDNVAQAIAAVRPAAVDTASGVEISPGRKSPEMVAAFIAAAKDAFDKVTMNR